MVEKKLLYCPDRNQWWPLPDGTRVAKATDGSERIYPEHVAGIIGAIMLQPELKPEVLPQRPVSEMKFVLVTPNSQNQFPRDGKTLTYGMVTRSLEYN